jgi:steroid delta-isomerase-like uncharacterized protein
MPISQALDRYFDAWNAHNPDAVVAAMASDGTYEDPTTGGPLSGEAFADNVRSLMVGFPDVRFELISVDALDDTRAAAQWLMKGTNSGPMPAGPATNQTIALPGCDFIDYDPAEDRLSKVVGYFDTATMLTQLGLQAHITPANMEPTIKFGIGVRVDTERTAIPGALTVTWIDVDSEHQFTVVNSTTDIIVEQLRNEGYLGSCLATVGRRNFTFTAWESVEAAKKALRGGAHAQAMRMFLNGELGETARGVTSIWTPERLNGLVRASTGKTADLAELDEQWI